MTHPVRAARGLEDGIDVGRERSTAPLAQAGIARLPAGARAAIATTAVALGATWQVIPWVELDPALLLEEDEESGLRADWLVQLHVTY